MKRREELLKICTAQTDKKEYSEKYADHLEELFDLVEPSKINESYAKAIENGDFASAVNILATYYRNKPDFGAGLSAKGSYSIEGAENTVNGVMREVSVDWTFPKGEIDFLFDPTEVIPPRNHEWLWQFNRHNYWPNLARAYVGTGDERYARAFQDQLLRWIGQTDIPERFNWHGSAWRTIECGIRLLGSWQTTFDGFRHSAEVKDSTILLMIASMHRQSVHLVKNPQTGNWLMMESNGVYTFSSLFPELSDAKANGDLAAERILRELKAQILPDGMHDELSPDYQGVVFGCATNFLSLAKALGQTVDQGFVDLIKSTVDAAINLSTPAFTQPRTNDTYTIPTSRFAGGALNVLGDLPEYRYISSDRKEGQPPKGETASRILPYAGFAAMRSDWGADASYLCFDFGPLGKGHMHQDKLNVNVFKGGEELIYDDGGGQYEESEARRYGMSGYSHNTLLVDGKAQLRREPLRADSEIDAGWISNEAYDYAYGIYDDTYGEEQTKPVIHKREIRFCKPEFFCISDTVTSADGKDHDYEILFHMDTLKTKTVPEFENGIMSDYGRKYDVLLVPIDGENAKPQLKTVSAQTEPNYRGWFVGRNDTYLHEATTVSREVKGVKDYRFTTLVFPMENATALPLINRINSSTVEVTFKGEKYLLDLGALNE